MVPRSLRLGVLCVFLDRFNRTLESAINNDLV